MANRSRWGGLGAAAACVVGIAGCFGSMFRSQVSGTVTADGTALGSFQAPLAICESGARAMFVGVDMATQDQQVLVRVLRSADLAQSTTITLVKAATPTEGIQLNRQNCSTLDVDVHPTNVEINDVRVMEGHASFDCALHTGGTVRGTITFANCH